MAWTFPKIYPILDSSFLPTDGRAEFLRRLGGELAAAGVTLIEYRNKTGALDELIADATVLRAAMPGPNIRLVLDDRADLVAQLGFDGAHVDDGDLTPADARKLLGPHRIVGTYGGTEALLPGILDQPADYFSIGPIGPTRIKQTTKPQIGVAGLRKMRGEAGPAPRLVAVGGVNLSNAVELLAAGASMLAVAGAIFRAPNPAAEFRRWQTLLG
jgi:thiamine-phosphate pyrophosphorylase